MTQIKRAVGKCGCRYRSAGQLMPSNYDKSRIVYCFLHRAAPNLLVMLEDVLEWLKTGQVNGIGYDEISVLDEIRVSIKLAKRGV